MKQKIASAGIQKVKKPSDPMRGVIESDHSQAPRTDVLPDDAVLDRNSFGSADSGYEGPNCIDRSDMSFEHRSRTEK